MERVHRTKEDSPGRNLPAIAIYRLEFFRRSENLVHQGNQRTEGRISMKKGNVKYLAVS